MKKRYGWTAALVLLSYVTVGIFLTLAPDRLPTHYGLDGTIDGWGSKYTYLLFPFFSTLIGVFLPLLGCYESKQGRADNERVLSVLSRWILVLFNCLWVFFLWKALAGTDLSQGDGLSEKLLLSLTTASLIPLGNIMPKAQRNSLFGLRTKWSLADDTCWQKSQRFGGYLLVISGMMGTGLICLLPPELGSRAMLVILTITISLAIFGSYRIWKQEQSRNE